MTNTSKYDKGYASGYQSALDDLASCYRRGGIAMLLTWGATNTQQEITRIAFDEAIQHLILMELTTKN